MKIHGKLVDIHTREITSVCMEIQEGKIAKIERNGYRGRNFILPGFIDAHIHIESSLLPPCEFARLAVRHGTVATVSDPQAMAHVLGIAGIDFMIENAKKVPFKFFFGAPSGSILSPDEVRQLLSRKEIKYLSEVMDVEKVIHRDPEIMEKINIAKERGKKIDGHAPGLFGEKLLQYRSAGIETDHQCSSLSEAHEKLALGMKILIREGSSAKNFNALFPLLREKPQDCMLCTDAVRPDHLLLGHINLLVRRAIEKGMDLFDVLLAACKNPVEHYGLEVGLLRVGDPADFILVEDLHSFHVIETYINGIAVFREDALFPYLKTSSISHFETLSKTPSDFALPLQKGIPRIISAIDGSSISHLSLRVENGNYISDVEGDILKIAIIDRFKNLSPEILFIHHFGLKKGAIATSAAQGLHLIAVGVTDEDLCQALDAIIQEKGGMVISHTGKTDILSFPIGGLMSNLPGDQVAVQYDNLNQAALQLGSLFKDPFMALSQIPLFINGIEPFLSSS